MENNRPPKIFTVEEANACLPLVRAIARDLSELARDVEERRARLNHLTAGRAEIDEGAHDPYASELAHVQRELQSDTSQLQEYARELRELGVEPKDALAGLVDFPSEMDGRLVYLCWKLDEPEVLYWHELTDGFRGRQALTAESVSGRGE